MGGPLDVTVFVKNLTKEIYDLDRQDVSSLLGFVGAVHNDPRTYGIELHYRFGR
jgi:iron complex outermembrane receptor protein